MTDQTNSSDESEAVKQWLNLISAKEFRDALVPTDTGLIELDSKLRELANREELDDDRRYLAKLLSVIASYMPNPGGFQTPYHPAIQLADGRRSGIPEDLSLTDLGVLEEIVEGVDNYLFRARVWDVIAIRSQGKQRVEAHSEQVASLIKHGVDHDSMLHAPEEWKRALEVASRFGAALQEKRDVLADLLSSTALSSDDGSLALMIARVLRDRRVGSRKASEIAEKLISVSKEHDERIGIEFLAEAAKWHKIAHDSDAENNTILLIVNSLVAQADSELGAEGRGAIVGVSLLERALKELRRIPKKERERLGIAELSTSLAQRIRESGAQAIGEMRTVSSESIDISGSVREVLNYITGQTPVEALRRFAGFEGICDYEAEKHAAEEISKNSVTDLLASVRYLDRDGRTSYKSGNGSDSEYFGVSENIWRRMIQSYSFRVSLLGGFLIPRAWMLVTSEHRLGKGEFESITMSSPIVPPDHENLFARGLFHGYNGDFATAAHLLAPQIEALVRYHLANVGEATSAIDEDGIENEVGLSALVKKEKFVDVFGPSLAFEIRALFASAFGPNVRNEIAHGLVDDSLEYSATSVYVWWFALKLVYLTYWNALHDVSSAEAREPSEPIDEEGDRCDR